MPAHGSINNTCTEHGDGAPHYAMHRDRRKLS